MIGGLSLPDFVVLQLPMPVSDIVFIQNNILSLEHRVIPISEYGRE